MSTSAPAKTKGSSQRPGTRAPPAGSTDSESEQEETQQRVSSRRRQSNVTFAAGAKSLAPSDSISRVKTRTGSGSSSDRRSRGSRDGGRSYRSRGSRASSGNGPPLTENNLERLKEAQAQERSHTGATHGGDGDPPSNTQEQPRSTRNASRYEAEVNDDRRTSRKTSRQYTTTKTVESQTQQAYSRRRSTAVGGGATDSSSQSNQQTQSRNVDAAYASKSTAKTTNAGQSRQTAASKSKSKAVSSTSSSADSSTSESASQSNKQSTKNGSQRNGEAAAASASASSAKDPESWSATVTQNPGGGWIRKTKVTTKRWPDGREIREREIRLIRAPAA